MDSIEKKEVTEKSNEGVVGRKFKIVSMKPNNDTPLLNGGDLYIGNTPMQAAEKYFDKLFHEGLELSKND